jgi:uncharacterized protein YjdB
VTGSWSGVVIPRSVPTLLTYKNNSITSVNTYGYMLQAGDEVPGSTNNKLDGEVITGNKFVWNGVNGSTVITHGLFVGYNINSVVRYNYLDKVPYGIIFKSGTDQGVNMTFTTGGCSYNICKNGKFSGRVKGINGVKFINNTFYSGDGKGWYLLLITENMDRNIPSPSIGTKVFNNIFYSTIQIPMIKIESESLKDFECDYNIYWCSAGEPKFNIDGATVSWSQWRARGYDAHSRIMNPNFKNTVDFVPAARLDYGINLGSEWETGLSATATWVAGSSPSTAIQNGTWQVGARVYSNQVVYVSAINVTGAAGANTISSDNGTLQLSAEVLPANASNKSVVWSIVNGTGQATISPAGLVSALANGTVTAKATATDGTAISGTILLTISNQVVPVASISVTGAGGSSIITAVNGTLQLSASVLPANATNKNVSWTISNGTGQATISSSGLVTAVSNGTVTARATANDGSGVYGSMTITISTILLPVTNISVTGAGGISTISTDRGTLQLIATVLPVNATNKTIAWSLTNNSGQATISATGVVTATADGMVTAIATATDGSGVRGTMGITISNQSALITSITVNGPGGATIITSKDGTLQLSTAILPLHAANKTVNWSITNGTGDALINSSGLVTALGDGTVTARATAADGSGIYGTLEITISGQIVPVTNITVTGENGESTITDHKGSLQLIASVLPSDATYKDVSWWIINGTEVASINSSGLVTAVENGSATAQATANDGSGVSGTMEISINHISEKPYSIIVKNDEIKIIFYEDFISCSVDLYNLPGIHIMRKIVDSDTVIFNTSHISPGLYIIVLSRGELLAVEKLMVP